MVKQILLCLVVLHLLTACGNDTPENPTKIEEGKSVTDTESEREDIPPQPVPEKESIPSEGGPMGMAYYDGTFDTYCPEAENENPIEVVFTATLERRTYHRGETVEIHAVMENVGAPFTHIPSYGHPEVYLRQIQEDGEILYLWREPVAIPEDIPGPTVWKTGEAWSQYNAIILPEDAPTGLYDIMAYSNRYTTILENGIEIIE